MTDDARSTPAHILHPENRLFADYVSGRAETLRLFTRAPGDYDASTRGPVDPALIDAIRDYNASLGASEQTIESIESLRNPTTRCVIGGHQAIFLGGPTMIAFKILSVVRVARSLTQRLGIPVVPIFWLATEDHDLDEVNRVRFLEADGSLQTVAFDWADRGQPIEALPITEAVRTAFDEARGALGGHAECVRRLLAPEADDDYGTWHARIRSRLFAEEGLIVVEPRTLRPFAAGFHREAIERTTEVTEALQQGAVSVRAAGYEPLLDPSRAGRPFYIEDDGSRRRIDDTEKHVSLVLEAPERYSSDVALRPILADRLFPTIASILGPGELAYHALLKPLYALFEAPQPVLVPRQGFTLLSSAESALLERLDIPAEDIIGGGFDPKEAIANATSAGVRRPFDDARNAVKDALRPLLPLLETLDPGLEARWRQTVQHAAQGIDRLEDRARGADLAQRGLSAKLIRRLVTSLRPTGKPQERVLSFAHFASHHGVEWLQDLPGSERPDRFAHHVVALEEDHEAS